MTLLSTTSLTGATTTISSIDQTYTNLYFVVSGVTNATTNGLFRCAPNGVTNVTWQQVITSGTINNASTTYISLSNQDYDLGSGSNLNAFTMQINNYASTTEYKTINGQHGYNDTGNVQRGGGSFGYVRTTSAITSLVFSNAGGNLSTGTVRLYGVK